MIAPAHGYVMPSNLATDKCHGDFSWHDLLGTIFPEKTSASAAFFTRTSVGAVEHVLRGRNGLSGKALMNLLRSPVGPRVLDAITGDAEWRAAERRLLDIAKLQDELAQLEQQRRHLVDRIGR